VYLNTMWKRILLPTTWLTHSKRSSSGSFRLSIGREMVLIFLSLFPCSDCCCPVNKIAKSLDRFMINHIKRWQVTIFLLCDLQSLQATLITPERLFFTFKLGTYFEWEGTIAHDLARHVVSSEFCKSLTLVFRWERDYEENEPNVYVFWLHQANKKSSPEALKEFSEEMEMYAPDIC